MVEEGVVVEAAVGDGFLRALVDKYHTPKPSVLIMRMRTLHIESVCCEEGAMTLEEHNTVHEYCMYQGIWCEAI